MHKPTIDCGPISYNDRSKLCHALIAEVYRAGAWAEIPRRASMYRSRLVAWSYSSFGNHETADMPDDPTEQNAEAMMFALFDDHVQ
jgi:hypothetical protein